MDTPNGSTGSSKSKARFELDCQLQLSSAIRGPSEVPRSVKLRMTPNFARHDKQLSKGRVQGGSAGFIAELNKLPDLIIDATEYCVCYEVDQAVQQRISLNDEQVFRSHLYLFS